MSLKVLISACLVFIGFSHPYLFAIPIVTSITPSNGSIIGGNGITINGSGFTGATSVDFGNRPAVAFNVISSTTISAIVPQGTAGTVDVTVTVDAQTSAKSAADFYTYTQSSWEGIISGINQDGVTLFDTGTNTINDFIPLPNDSLAAIMTPDGTRIYTADNDQPSVTVIDAATNTIIDVIPTSVGVGAFDIIVSPDGKRLYMTNNLSGFVTVIDTTTNTVVTDIFLAPNLGPLSITPDGKTVYVSNFTLGNVTTIDTASNSIGTSILTGAVPGMISITPDGKTAYVSNSGSDTISIIDVATNVVIDTINSPVGAGPYGSSIIPNGKTMYVANISNSTVSVVDLASNTIVQTIPFLPGSRPFWIASTPDGKTVYVINETTDNVTPIDVATNIAGASFANITGDIQDIVMSPDQAPVASFLANLAFVGSSSQFDASASISPIGTISNYFWDFGDGTTVATNSPIINHIYTTSGPFLVTLTVTNSAGTSISKVFSSRFMSNNGGPTATSSQLINILPLPEVVPPINLKGFQKANRFVSQTDYINIITWSPPLKGLSPVAYRIYRDRSLHQLLATVSSHDELKFKDHNRKKNKTYTYYIVSVAADGTISKKNSITIRPRRSFSNE